MERKMEIELIKAYSELQFCVRVLGDSICVLTAYRPKSAEANKALETELKSNFEAVTRKNKDLQKKVFEFIENGGEKE